MGYGIKRPSSPDADAKTEASIPLHEPHNINALLIPKQNIDISPPASTVHELSGLLYIYRIYLLLIKQSLPDLRKMASNVIVIYNLRRLQIKVLPTRSLSDVHTEACKKFNLDPLRYTLKCVFTLPGYKQGDCG